MQYNYVTSYNHRTAYICIPAPRQGGGTGEGRGDGKGESKGEEGKGVCRARAKVSFDYIRIQYDLKQLEYELIDFNII